MERLAGKVAIITGARARLGGAATWSAPHAHMMIARGLVPADAPMALNKLVAKLLDLPAPMGAATSFLGTR